MERIIITCTKKICHNNKAGISAKTIGKNDKFIFNLFIKYSF